MLQEDSDDDKTSFNFHEPRETTFSLGCTIDVGDLFWHGNYSKREELLKEGSKREELDKSFFYALCKFSKTKKNIAIFKSAKFKIIFQGI